MENRPASDETEITILEYLKSLLARGAGQGQGSVGAAAAEEDQEPSTKSAAAAVRDAVNFPWFSTGAALLALIAQLFAVNRMALFSLLFFAAAAACLLLGLRAKEWKLPLNSGSPEPWQFFTGKTWLLFPGLALGAAAFFLFRSQRFTLTATLCWAAAVTAVLLAFWNKAARDKTARAPLNLRIQKLLKEERAWFFMLLLVSAVVAWFSFAHLKAVPPELVSGEVDHIYSVRDVLSGNAVLLHSRNLVSEPLQYLWGALFSFAAGGQTGFVELKAAYALANLAALYFIYRLAADLFDRWVGLTAALLLGISFWQIIQTRALLGSGLVLPLACAALYFLFSGLQKHQANDLALSALFAGLGLLTNKIFLIFPVVALVVGLIWLVTNHREGSTKAFFSAAAQALLLGAVVSVPLLRAISLEPQAYFAPILSRVSDYETALSGSPVRIFLTNLWNALGIVNWSNRSSWVDGLTLRPGMDLLSAAFFGVGVCAAAFTLRKTKDWRVLALLALYPLLLLPSAMSLAFPLENPSLSRALTALVPACILSSIGLRIFLGALFAHSPAGKGSYKLVLSALLLLFAIGLNDRAAFSEYPTTFRQNAWNNTEMANVIRQTELDTGYPQNVWVIGYPYWVDARAVALEAQRPDQVLGITADQLEQTANVLGPKMFLIHPLDSATVEKLQQLYPTGTIAMVQSSLPDKNFLVFLVKQ
ncbi:MAG TPA: glycosyltransferase family 39 protein [Anaerolineaceae bacterium]|nr:glycosyltransferase family 39 protein [Anaerolineaceae bacterium]